MVQLAVQLEVVLVVRTRCNTSVFVDTTARVHLIMAMSLWICPCCRIPTRASRETA